MSVTGKTLGVILIGLVGLLVYVAVYTFSALGFYATGGSAVATVAIYVALALTAIMMVVISILARGGE